ncbi:DUF2721 domain-containing protein [Bradyrhizobium sp. CCBAU 53421]|uniref:DUF2721 domain-containing protein n=1 Tax=Bradyrhizobium sp. CCBAU 53421 TaxID=1325120 RepID=UPI00188A6772|nr:DUF2721 domain-containing protein [Bradyrhizobium sp. CCBAU 53421]QOZ35892.1 DUF2721 domain-containing protein [Bradyrhizobium sp. CCBAU 53421]
MLIDTPTAAHLSQVISQVAAPAFLLGAVAAFVSLLIGRMNRVVDRLQALHATADDGRSGMHPDIPHLERRAVLLNKAIVLATVSAIVTSLLVILAFVCTFFQFQHEYGVALLFVVALSFFTLSLVDLVREARLSLHDLSHHKPNP